MFTNTDFGPSEDSAEIPSGIQGFIGCGLVAEPKIFVGKVKAVGQWQGITSSGRNLAFRRKKKFDLMGVPGFAGTWRYHGQAGPRNCKVI